MRTIYGDGDLSNENEDYPNEDLDYEGNQLTNVQPPYPIAITSNPKVRRTLYSISAQLIIFPIESRPCLSWPEWVLRRVARRPMRIRLSRGRDPRWRRTLPVRILPLITDVDLNASVPTH
jgi:hypothetical protein